MILMKPYPQIKISIALLILITFATATCCAARRPYDSTEWLVKVRNRTANVDYFNELFEITKTAYPYRTLLEPEVYKTTCLYIIEQIIEELILSEIAEDLKITVSDEEIKEAVAKVKENYPGDYFKRSLLRQAISYNTWEGRIKKRLLMEKVIKESLQVTLTKADIAEYYAKFREQEKKAGEEPPEYLSNALSEKQKNINDEMDINKVIIKLLRRKKTEETYKTWIASIKKDIELEINKPVLSHIIAGQYVKQRR